MTRRGDVQGLRGIAVLLVVAYHSGLALPGGFVGVDVFFVISGYVIGRMLLGELDNTGSIDLRAFYSRRIRRLLPALSTLLIVVAALATLLASPLGPQQATARTGIAASLFSANLQLFQTPTGYFDLAASANALLHTWSLSLEEQFYLVFPSVLLLAWRLRPDRRTIAALVTAISVLSFAVSLYVTRGHGDALAHRLGGTAPKLAFYLPVTRAWEFGLGILVALARRPTGLVAEATSGVGLALIVFTGFLRLNTDAFPGLIALAPTIGTTLAIAGGADTAVSRQLSRRALTTIGDLSYSWYLWHWPAIVFASALWPGHTWARVTAAGAALIPAAISYRWIESPIRRDERFTGARSVGLFVICVALSLAASCGLRFVASREAAGTPALVAALQQHADETRGCNGGGTLDDATVEHCTWKAQHANGTIFLLGDSNAGQLTEAAAKAANEAGFDLAVATRSSCPFVDLLVSVRRHDASGCHAFVVGTIRELARRRPSLVILASSSVYIDDDAIELREPRSGAAASSTAVKALLWENGIRNVIVELERAGIPTLVVHPVPRLASFSLATCPYVRLGGAAPCAPSAPRAEIERQQAAQRDAEKRALAPSRASGGLDVTDQLCSQQECPATRDDTWLYRDAGHLSVAGALSLTESLEQAISAHARR